MQWMIVEPDCHHTLNGMAYFLWEFTQLEQPLLDHGCNHRMPKHCKQGCCQARSIHMQ